MLLLNSKRQRKLLIIAVGLFFISYLAFYFTYLAFKYNERAVKNESDFKKLVYSVSTLPYFKDEFDLITYLEDKRNLDNIITSYAVLYRGKIIKAYPEEYGDKINNAINHLGNINETKNEFTAHFKVNLNDRDYEVKLIQSKLTMFKFMMIIFFSQVWIILGMVIFLTLPIATALYLSRAQIIALWTALSQAEGDTSKLKLSEDSEEFAIKTSHESAKQLNQQLLEKNKTLEYSLESGQKWLAEQIKNGVSEVPATLFVIDMNAFTGNLFKLEGKSKQDEFEVLFKSWAREIFSRYGAMIDGDLGDGYLGFIPQDVFEKHELACFHMVRTFFEESHYFDQYVFEQTGLKARITFKAAIVPSKIRIKEYDAGSQHRGTIFSTAKVETDRILQLFKEDFEKFKQQNTIAFFEKDYERFSGLCERIGSAQIKGKSSDGVNFGVAVAAQNLRGLSTQLLSLEIKDNFYFRSVLDVVECLRWVRNPNNDAVTFILLNELKKFPYSMNLDLIFNEFLTSLNKMTHDLNRSKVFTSLVILAGHVFKNSAYKNIIADKIRPLQSIYDKRLNAEVNESLRSLINDTVNFHDIQLASNNRSAANTLVHFIKQNGFEQRVYDTLKEWLISSDVLYAQSALYVIYITLKYFREENPRYFKTNNGFPEYSSLILGYLSSPNPELKKWAVLYSSEIQKPENNAA